MPPQKNLQVIPRTDVARIAAGYMPDVRAPFGSAFAQVFVPNPDEEQVGIKPSKGGGFVVFHPERVANPAFQNRSLADRFPDDQVSFAL